MNLATKDGLLHSQARRSRRGHKHGRWFVGWVLWQHGDRRPRITKAYATVHHALAAASRLRLFLGVGDGIVGWRFE